jgi:hypothetical protein
MFCPNCRTEYRAGITICADCGAELVNELPPDHSDIAGPVTVLETGNLAVLELAKSMLDEAGIRYIAKGELPMAQLAIGPVEIQVSLEDEDEAKELLEDLEKGNIGDMGLEEESAEEES